MENPNLKWMMNDMNGGTPMTWWTPHMKAPVISANPSHPRMVHAAVLSTRDSCLYGAHLHPIWLAVLDERYRAYGTLVDEPSPDSWPKMWPNGWLMMIFNPGWIGDGWLPGRCWELWFIIIIWYILWYSKNERIDEKHMNQDARGWVDTNNEYTFSYFEE